VHEPLHESDLEWVTWYPGTTREIEPGSYVLFPAGEPVMHYLENRSGSPCKYLMIGERIPDDVATHLPSSA
jgi:uncharacterized cupin superfamily protein